MPSAVRGSEVASSNARGAHHAGNSAFTSSRSASSDGGSATSTGTTTAVTRRPHSGSGRPMTATSATRVGRHQSLTGSGHVLAAADDQVVGATGDGEPARRRLDRPDVTRPVPPRRVLGVGAVAVAAQHRRARQGDGAVVADHEPDTVERQPVVDDPGTRLGHPIGGDRVGGPIGGNGRAAEQDASEQRGVDAAQCGGYERDVRRSRQGRQLDVGGIERRVDDEAGAAQERPGDHREPADVVQGEAGQPGAVGVDAEIRRGRVGGEEQGVVGQHHPLRGAGRAARRHHDGVAGFGRATVEPTALTVGLDDRVRFERLDDRGPPGAGEAGVEGEDCVAGVPHRLQRCDEGRSAFDVDRHESGHGARVLPVSKSGANRGRPIDPARIRQ